jgi:hypothetical protein
MVSLLSPARPDHIGQAFGGQLEVGLPSLARALLKGVEHVNGLLKLGHIEHSVFHARVNADLSNSRAHGAHGLPVTGKESLLKAPELITGLAPGSLGEGPEILKGCPDPAQRLVSHRVVYK